MSESNIFVIFGGTGDLSRKKLLPALARLVSSGILSEKTHVLGIARNPDYNDESFRELVKTSIIEAGISETDILNVWKNNVYYQRIVEGDIDSFRQLDNRLKEIERRAGLSGNRVFYLALPPQSFSQTVNNLGEAELNHGPGWTRLLIEKPFGYDLLSSIELNKVVHRHFSEEQVYRIDHYLGKESVQNLLVFRFGNAIFEHLWNRDKISAVQITVSESKGVGTRAEYFDRSGTFRDMVQNHMMQLLSLIAMEVPSRFDAPSIRYEKLKVMRSLAPIHPYNVVFGQYQKGKIRDEYVPGYLQEPGVPENSRTETFVAMKVEIENWRWQGVPFYLRTGKRLSRQTTQILLQFKNTPICMFKDIGGACTQVPNFLILTLQPDEGFELRFSVKKPGAGMHLIDIPLSFKYRDLFAKLPDAYETLLYDIVAGDQTLFVHADEIETSWRVCEPILTSEQKIVPYETGSSGPLEAMKFAIPGSMEPHV